MAEGLLDGSGYKPQTPDAVAPTTDRPGRRTREMTLKVRRSPQATAAAELDSRCRPKAAGPDSRSRVAAA